MEGQPGRGLRSDEGEKFKYYDGRSYEGERGKSSVKKIASTSPEMPLQRTKNFFFLLSLNEFFFFQPQHAASEGLWSLPTRCLSRSFPENVLNKHTFGTMALKGEEISSAKNQTLLVKVQQPLRKTPESRAPENPTSPHVWPIQNVCLPQHISTFFYPFRWSQLIDHERALSTDSREGRPFVQTTRTGSKANKRSAKQVPFAPN